MRDRIAFFRHPAAALFAGILIILAYAPYGFSVVQIISVAFLFHLIINADGTRQAFFIGWAYGTGWMTAGVYWLYISMHQFGGLNQAMAIAAVLALGLFMGLLPALAVTLAMIIRRRFGASDFLMAMLILPSALCLAEWTRGWLFTGFPWVVLGYAHTDNALSGFAPVIGVYGITLLATVLAGSALILFNRKQPRRNAVFLIALAIIVGGYGLKFVHWTTPVDAPIRVRLLQGNVPQEMKFSPDQVRKTLALYEEMITASPADLIVTPETAIPQYLHTLSPEWYKKIEKYAVDSHATLAIGIPLADSVRHYTNSLITVSPDSDKPHHINYRYDKQHLVPFGEFVPFGFRWFVNLMRIPLGDFARGPEIQQPFRVKNQWILPNICYEDIFGEEIARQIRAAIKDGNPEPGMMLNLSNIAWFGDSLALPQHLQISRMRSLEMQRPMLRATNTGVTAIIDARGNVQGQLPSYSFATLETELTGMNGMTPYIRFGNHPAIIACLILFFGGATLAHRHHITREGYRKNPLAGKNDQEELL
jgi:apolipoprotein N-acyltransferase